MASNHIAATGQQEAFEVLIQGLIDRGFGTIDGFLDEETVNGLRRKLLLYKRGGKMHPAGIGRSSDFQQNAAIRGDVIRWIDKEPENRHEKLLMTRIRDFTQYLNSTCYDGINDYEFHYACYEKNSFYKRHLDQFKSNKGRKYSLVIYLNKDWKPQHGGKLSLFLDDGRVADLLPCAGRAVFFRSDAMEHEVSPSIGRYRISIAGWMKQV